MRRIVALFVVALFVAIGLPGCEKPCEDDSNACTIDCVAGKSAHEAMPEGATCALAAHTGICAQGVCVRGCAKDADCNDGDPCTLDKCTGGACANVDANGVYFGADDPDDCSYTICANGAPRQIVVVDGTPCGSAGGECDHGVCSKCETAVDCGTSTLCQKWACANGACSSYRLSEGQPVADSIKYDCRTPQCDGAGNIVLAANEKDIPPDDAKSCIAQTCEGWTTVFVPKLPGTPCLDAEGKANFCDGNGACVACVKDTDCPTWGDHCYAGSCHRCDDGKQNGDETGLDCGGNDCPDCLGDACVDAASCKSGFCEDGVCCNMICGLCATCTAEGSNGTCKAIPEDYKDPVGCSAANKACNGQGLCRIKNGYPCANGLDCISNKCTNGICMP